MSWKEVDAFWICEKGHLDDHHLDDPNSEDRCSRCGGHCERLTLGELARRSRFYRHAHETNKEAS